VTPSRERRVALTAVPGPNVELPTADSQQLAAAPSPRPASAAVGGKPDTRTPGPAHSGLDAAGTPCRGRASESVRAAYCSLTSLRVAVPLPVTSRLQ
jgi:hypothetical protein